MGFWAWLQDEHPVLYEVLQWGLFAVAVGALVVSVLALRLS